MMLFNKKTICSIFAVLLLVSCESELIDQATFGTLTGTVLDEETQAPLENAKVSTSPSTSTVFTDATGAFTINDMPEGDYAIRAEYDGYLSGFEPATVTAGATYSLVIEMVDEDTNNVGPNRAALTAPADNASVFNTEVEFGWTSGKNDSDELSYDFELRNGTTDEIISRQNLADTTLTLDALVLGTQYFWQVTSSDGLNPSVISNVSSFKIEISEENRFLFVRSEDNNNTIISGGNQADAVEVNVTTKNSNAYAPAVSPERDRVAYIQTVGSNDQIFLMDSNGFSRTQLTTNVPAGSFRNQEIKLAWNNQGDKIYYPRFNKLYAVNSITKFSEAVYSTDSDRMISKVDVNPATGEIAMVITDADGYQGEIVVYNPADLSETVVFSSTGGALGGLDYSIDGTTLLYTADITGEENAQHRKFDNRIFSLDMATLVSSEVNTGKEIGYNETDPFYSPNGAEILYVNRSNDDFGDALIYVVPVPTPGDTNALTRTQTFSNGSEAVWY